MPASSKQIIGAVAFLLVQSYASLGVDADLRLATTPKQNYAVQNQNGAKAFVTKTAIYMEPSTFNYAGLANQKANNYDNFLRSNIDNEQDNRNFNTEAGRDMLPFRTLEAADQQGAAVTMTVGQEVTIPMRWNNPHSSEAEVNVWIMDNQYVVPIKKPVCSGEGYQDVVLTATIPANFNDLAGKVPGFTGCTKIGDCTLQIYAHSVEPRTYSIGYPLIVAGGAASTLPPATDTSAIRPISADPGADLSKQPYPVCLPGSDPSSNIASAEPRVARQVSDVYNHAYQNSDYSPYSGQQQESISANMQAACVLRMTAANHGELGKTILTNEQTQIVQRLINKVNGVVAKYENAADNLLKRVNNLAESKVAGKCGSQDLAGAARTGDVCSVNTNRISQATYIPAFKVAANVVDGLRNSLNNDMKKMISAQNVVQIYTVALEDVKADFDAAAKSGIVYQPAELKIGAKTLVDPTSFKKLDANGKQDNGKYAATMAAKTSADRAKAVAAAYAKLAVAATPRPTPAPTPVPTPVPRASQIPLPPAPIGGQPLPGNPDDLPQGDSQSTDGQGDDLSGAASAQAPASFLAAAAGALFFYLKM